MKTLPEIVASSAIKSISDYLSLDREIGLVLKGEEILVSKKINIAIISSSTIQGISEVLRVQCAQMNILANIYVGEYNQYAQEVLNPDSGLYQFNPDIVIIHIDTRAIAGDHFFLPYEMTEKERRVWVEEVVGEFANLVDTLCQRLSAKILIHNLEVPNYSPLGLVERKQNFGFFESIESINKVLGERYRKSSQVFVFDYESLCSKFGKNNIFDYKLYYMGDIKFKPQYIPALCNEYSRYVRALVLPAKKCIILDLDNTLWGGVIGESEIGEIFLGPTSEGRPFLEFQKYLLSLFKRGVILAINSKNNPDDALNVLRNHPHMVLRENHFAALRINWDDKVANMKSIAEELNIGLDSLVFIDDDEVNREMVREFIPEVAVVDLPRDSAQYVNTLMNLNYFDSLALTEEDKNKGVMYFEDKKRREVARNATDLTEYLRMLEIIVCVEDANKDAVPRASQLTQKTNQFNMTTRRYSEEAIRSFVGSPKFRVISVHYSDRFGDNGLTGLAVLEVEDCDRWRIDTFLLSCRIIGRGAEEALLAYIINTARKMGVKVLCGEYIPSKKNVPARQFYEKNRFSKVRKVGQLEIWEYDLADDYSVPSHISLKSSFEKT